MIGAGLAVAVAMTAAMTPTIAVTTSPPRKPVAIKPAPPPAALKLLEADRPNPAQRVMPGLR